MARISRFVFTPRWIGLLVFALVVATTCVRLGIWQLDRLEERRALNERIRSGLSAATSSSLGEIATRDPGSLAYRRVEVTGTYDLDHEVLLYGRSLDGRPGHHVLTPLVYGGEAGTAVIVDRGWVPIELDAPPVVTAAPPEGAVTVIGFLLPVEETDDVVIDRDASGRVLTVRVDVPTALEGEIPYQLFPLPVQLQEQSPAQAGDLPVAIGPPQLTEGPHLSYAGQWFTFATIALVGYVVLVRREVRDRARDAERTAEVEAG